MSKRLDMSKLRVTVLSKNQRTHEPRPANGGEEIKIQAQKIEVLKQTKKVLKDNNKDTNLTAQQIVGKLKLLKRKKQGELVIFPTDKSGKLVVCLPETYLEAGRVHTSKDQQVEWSELPTTETKVNRHTRALTKIINLGASHNGQEQRIAGATKSVDSPAPPLYLMWKDHKQYETVPPTRPVCSGVVGPLARASELSSLILTAFLDSLPPGTECLSSEEMQRAILDTNIIIKERKLEKVDVFSMDVSALYPSLHMDDILEAVMLLITKSQIMVDNLDTKEMGKYLSVVMEQEEIEARGLGPHIPRRTVVEEGAATKRPTIAYLDCDTYVSRRKGQRAETRPKWSWSSWKEPRERQRKVMFALVMREQVRTIISNHLYSFGGNLYRQASGGPIGLQLTTILARAVMINFDSKFKASLSKLKLEPLLSERYVDDQNMATKAIPRGMVLQEDAREQLELVVDPIKARSKEERERKSDARTADLYRQVADSVMPKSIRMEADVPSAHTNGRLPILDMEVWMDEQEGITFSFYSKPMASKDVMLATSAFPLKTKKNILLEEASRRLRSCSPHIPWPDKAKHLTYLNLQMLRCGHAEEFRSMVTTRAVAKYHTSLGNHIRGTKRMYRTRAEMVDQWAREGGKATKSDWFRKSGATGVFNVAATRDSRLATAVQSVLDTVPGPRGSKVLVQERPGSSVKSALVSSNPFPRASCGRRYCPWTAKGEECKERCYRENVGYAARCTRCHTSKVEEGVEDKEVEDTVYLGESSNTLPTRSEAHYKDYRQDMRREPGGEGRRRGGEGEEEDSRRGVSSWMADHTRDTHNSIISDDPITDYEFIIVSSFIKPLQRQIDEYLRMERVERSGRMKVGKEEWRVKVPLLNRKHEYWAPRNLTYTFDNFNRPPGR